MTLYRESEGSHGIKFLSIIHSPNGLRLRSSTQILTWHDTIKSSIFRGDRSFREIIVEI